MKTLRVIIAVVMGLSVIWTLALLLISNPLWKWGIPALALCFGVVAIAKAVYQGTDTLRGKFHIILGLGALIFVVATAATVTSTSLWVSFPLHYLARLVFIVSVAMMFLGLMKQGYTLSSWEWTQVLSVFVILAGVGLWLFYGLYAGASLAMTVLVFMSLFILLETLPVVRVYLGSSLGARWTAGAGSVICITIGDMSMAYAATSGVEAWSVVQFLGWAALCLIMGIVSLIFD